MFEREKSAARLAVLLLLSQAAWADSEMTENMAKAKRDKEWFAALVQVPQPEPEPVPEQAAIKKFGFTTGAGVKTQTKDDAATKADMTANIGGRGQYIARSGRRLIDVNGSLTVNTIPTGDAQISFTESGTAQIGLTTKCKKDAETGKCEPGIHPHAMVGTKVNTSQTYRWGGTNTGFFWGFSAQGTVEAGGNYFGDPFTVLAGIVCGGGFQKTDAAKKGDSTSVEGPTYSCGPQVRIAYAKFFNARIHAAYGETFGGEGKHLTDISGGMDLTFTVYNGNRTLKRVDLNANANLGKSAVYIPAVVDAGTPVKRQTTVKAGGGVGATFAF